MSVSKFLACLLVLLAAAPAAGAQTAPTMTITVHATQPLGPTADDLVGFGWNTASLDGVAALAPHTVRIDARLEEASTGPDALDLTDLLSRVAEVRSIGAEPLVILSYMPAWLGGNANGRDPTKVFPSDTAAWKKLIKTVVTTVASAPAPAYRFEVWNEPDNPIFWQELPSTFIDLAVLTHTAVAEAEAEMQLQMPLQIGGPATVVPDPIFAVPYVNAMKDNDLPLDFLSWHYYGNTPFLGPDGAEDILPAYLLPLYGVIGQPNPATSPRIYGDQVAFMRALRDALLAGSDLDPSLVIDEWNLSAGGYDLRHDTNEGAAFAAGTLIEMERGALDAADFYRAASTVTPAHAGDWGVVDATGARKPVWSVFDAWNRTAGTRLAVDGDDSFNGVWARATASDGGFDVLLVSRDARGGTDRTVAVRVPGGCSEVRRVDSTSSTFGTSTSVDNVDGAITLDVPAQSVTWLSVSAACAALPTRAGDGGLARTGRDDDALVAVGAAFVLLALTARRMAVRRR